MDWPGISVLEGTIGSKVGDQSQTIVLLQLTACRSYSKIVTFFFYRMFLSIIKRLVMIKFCKTFLEKKKKAAWDDSEWNGSSMPQFLQRAPWIQTFAVFPDSWRLGILWGFVLGGAMASPEWHLRELCARHYVLHAQEASFTLFPGSASHFCSSQRKTSLFVFPHIPSEVNCNYWQGNVTLATVLSNV